MAYRKNADRDEDKAKAYELEQVCQSSVQSSYTVCFFHMVVVSNGVLALLLCLGSGRVFPSWGMCLVPITSVSVHHGVYSVPGSLLASNF